jgi:hypothetical protein
VVTRVVYPLEEEKIMRRMQNPVQRRNLSVCDVKILPVPPLATEKCAKL